MLQLFLTKKDHCMNKKTNQDYAAVKPVERQCQHEKQQVVIAYLIFNTVLYKEYFFHVLTDNTDELQHGIQENNFRTGQ